ncbi:MAG: hypothetical protein Terrestrivirus1_240 [Terrestrivirus sp.]|uniref:Alpha-ketoglutarate-dependent dioxygenase AlkB-like domain-containing protein n=1 Tax=Terrestrivirus sp. TaxID=2487775 RepID=A0A3G4ZKJ8_9VIRU|nr:MAG: hypothetical protein Terrestrivirus1_240 [Terrestrivirus sp.]
MGENILLRNKHVLVSVGNSEHHNELNFIKENFCGNVFTDATTFNNYANESEDILIYVCGNIQQIYENIKNLQDYVVYVIKELSTNYEFKPFNLISIGQVPINIHNAGVYFRNFFDSYDTNYFDRISKEHEFQVLTESNKTSNAFRNGIYLTKVQQISDEDEVKFNLLRCSTNLNGPTDNFRSTDNLVIDKLNQTVKYFFDKPIEFNHVLAQTYLNKAEISENKNVERKAKISAHSDKTKDMPQSALIAFCTFYENYSNDEFSDHKTKQIKKNGFDYCYNDVSVLTRLHFKLKNMVSDPDLVKEFSVTLYPNSVFIISLSTNRLYTHEIRPSVLPVDKIPTRMGYVVRCSKTKAVFRNDQVYVDEAGDYVKLTQPNNHDIKELKQLYYDENTTDEIINYGSVYFSLNSGDYTKPLI